MTLLITHNSALEYWRVLGMGQLPHKRLAGRVLAPLATPGDEALRRVVSSGLSQPIDVMVSSASARRRTGLARHHVMGKALPGRQLVDVGDGLLVASPELCFLQLAAELPLAKLVELGLELCGSYSLIAPGSADMPNQTRGFITRPPLTSHLRLGAFLDPNTLSHRQLVARTALGYIADGAASPMESVLSILLTLPYRHGGYGLPMPELNRRIMIKAPADRVRDTVYFCDLYWPDAKVAAEYDSDMYHTGASRIASDSIRRNDLALAGITVVSVTNRQIRSITGFESVAQLLARSLGKKLRPDSNPRFAEAQRGLRGMLLPASRGFSH